MKSDHLKPTPCPLPVVASTSRAGFPSPAEDYVEGHLDLNTHLIRRPAATFIVRVQGDSMTGAGIFSGDLLVVDRAVRARRGHVVIALVGGDLTVKRLGGRPGSWLLEAAHPDYPPIELAAMDEDGDAAIWGVAVGVVRKLTDD